MRVPGTTAAIARWVALQVRNHLEDILIIARSGVNGYGLSDDKDRETNKWNFKAATFLSAYLHRYHIPTSARNVLVSTKLLFLIIADVCHIIENAVCLHESCSPPRDARGILCFNNIHRTPNICPISEVSFIETRHKFNGI